MGEPRATVNLFGKPVHAVVRNGAVMFERDTFLLAVAEGKARRVYEAMNDCFSFLGKDGVDTIIEDRKEHLLCELVLVDRNADPVLREYAEAWMQAYFILRDEL